LCSTLTFAQREADNWFFGQGVGLRFNTGGKPSIQSGSLNTLEGCASISDSDGNLLFYSDGSTVWNYNHQVMPNGSDLLGDASSSQSAIIVPNPKKSHIYYLFTVGSTIEPNGFHYYTIDLTLDNGRGDVAEGPVNLSGDNGEFWSEKITAVETSTCDSYWVISLVDDVFHAFRVDESGVNTTPVLSLVNFLSWQSRGYLKVSPDGSYIAAAHQGQFPRFTQFILYSFNNETGEVVNDGQVLFDPMLTSSVDAPYGVEFSAQSTKLYMTTTDMDEDYKLYQYDLESDDIPGSMTLIHEEDAFRGALQLGPDQKIYATIPVAYEEGTHFLDVIHFPERKGLACTFEENNIDFGSGYTMQGLPPFIQSLFVTEDINIVDPSAEVSETSSDLSICYNQSFVLQGEEIPGAVYTWTFQGEGEPITLPTPSPAHQLEINPSGADEIGTYTLTVETNDDCDTKLIGIAHVTFTDPPEIAAEATIEACDRFDEDPNDGSTVIDLEQSLDQLISGNRENYRAYFFLSEEDAIADQYNTGALPEEYRNTQPVETLYAKIYSGDSHCYSLAPVHLTVYMSTPISVADESVCDNGDGTGTLDLNMKRQEIRTTTGETQLEIRFYALLDDAVNDVHALPDMQALDTATLYFSAWLNGLCYGSGSFELDVLTMPDFEALEDLIQCESQYPILLSSPLPPALAAEYDHIWSDGQTGVEAEVNNAQTLILTMIHKVLGCTEVKTFRVIDAGVPVIDQVLIHPNSRSIEVISNDPDQPLFALDDPNGPYQEGSFFYDVYPGTYEIFVKNQYDCGIGIRTVYVFGVPQFFTPNNDGINDKWEIKGVDPAIYTISDIHIFNRFGKHLYSIPPDHTWDGSYNGKLLPADDYWYRFSLTDQSNIIQVYKGHFSLIRR
jgi:gliding motility-associated-like protein